MRRAAVIALLIATASGPARADFSAASRGTSAATFLSLGGGARAAGMGGAQTAAAEGASAVIWNAAAPATLGVVELEAMRGDWFEEADYNFAAGVLPFGEGNAVSVSYQQFGAGDLDRRDDSGFADGTFAPEDQAIGLGFAWTAGDYRMGVLGKMIRSEIVSSASTFAGDIGLMSPEENGRRWGLAVTNVGGRLKYDYKEEEIASAVSAGGVQRFGRHAVAADIKFPRDNRAYVAVGAEAGLALGGELEGRGRFGYNTRSGAESGSLAGFSVGAGVKARWFSVDYAFAPFGDLGSVHLFSLALRGGGNAER